MLPLILDTYTIFAPSVGMCVPYIISRRYIGPRDLSRVFPDQLRMLSDVNVVWNINLIA